jgi:hypothetical protein
MPLTTDQLRSAFAKLNGHRDVRIKFDHADPCVIAGALLVPAEDDKIIKLTDGSREYLIDTERIAWVEIG